MSKCKNCVNLRYNWCEKVSDSPDENMERECVHFRQMTNADRIRSMTDEELADSFRMWCRGMEDCADCHLHYEDCPGSCEFSAWIKWLQQPAEGE